MAITRKMYKGKYMDCQQEFVCDTRADVANLPTQTTENNRCVTGSTAFVIEDSSEWMLNSLGEWKVTTKAAGSASGGGGETGVVTIEESESEEYQKIYTIKQGETVVGTINIPKDDDTVPTEEGAHGLRYYNNTLQYYDGSKWVTLYISNLLV